MSGSRAARETGFVVAGFVVAALLGALASGCGSGVAVGSWQLAEELDPDPDPDATFRVTSARALSSGEPVKSLESEDCGKFILDNSGVPNGGERVQGTLVLEDANTTDSIQTTKVFVSLGRSTKDGKGTSWSSSQPALNCGTLEPGVFGAGAQTFCFDSKQFGKDGPEKVDVRVCPRNGDENDCDTFTCTIDNRPDPPVATVIDSSVQDGVVSIRYSFPPGTRVSTKVAPREEAIHAGDVCTEGFLTEADEDAKDGEVIYTTEWNSNLCFQGKSALTCPRVFFSFEGTRDAAYSFGECFRVNNSVPRAVISRVDSYPRVTAEDVPLVGQIIVDYEVEDLGEEPCKLAVEATLTSKDLAKSITLKTEPDDPKYRLTEALGGESGGTTGRATSGVGVDHTFIWNSDHDLDRLRRLEEVPGLTQPMDVRLILTVENEKGESRKSQSLPARARLDSRSMHAISGVLPGQTDRGTDSVSVKDLTFEEISDVEIQDTVLYITDPATNVVWEGPFDAEADSLRRIAGNGGRRASKTSPGGLADEVPLFEPIDLEVLSDEKALLLERGGYLLSLENLGGQRVIETLIDDNILLRPLALAVDSRGEFAYIADTGNCRILKYDIKKDTKDVEMKLEVIYGDLKTVDPEDDSKIGDEFPRLNGCNFLLTPDEDDDNDPNGDGAVDFDIPPARRCRPDFKAAPAGLAYFAPEGCSGREYLLFSLPLRHDSETNKNGRDWGQILYLDLGSIASGTKELRMGEENCPTYPGDMSSPLSVFTRPKSLEVIEDDGLGPMPFLYFVNDGIRHSGGGVSRSLLARGVLSSDDCASLTLLRVEPVAGRLISLTEEEAGRFECGCGDNSATTYRGKHECLQALAAPVANISSTALGPDGEVYFSDRFNQRIRFVDKTCGKVDPERKCLDIPELPADRLRTFLGGTVQRDPEEPFSEKAVLGFESLDVDEKNGRLLSTGQGVPSDRLRKLSEPTGLAFLDNTNLLFTETGSNRILRLDLETLLLTTVAGKDSDEECLGFSDGNGLATSANLSAPTGIAIHPAFRPRIDAVKDDTSEFWKQSNRRVYFCDRGNNRVRMIDAEGKISTLVGSGTEFEGTNCCREKEMPVFNDLPCTPRCDDSTTEPDCSKGKPGRRVFINRPESVVTDEAGRVFIADRLHRILKVDDPDSKDPLVFHVAGNPCVRDDVERLGRLLSPNKEFDEDDYPEVVGVASALEVYLGEPGEMVFDRDYEFLYYADTERGRIRRLKYEKDGTFSTVVTVAGNGSGDSLSIEEGFCRPALTVGIGTPYGLALDDEVDPPVLYFGSRVGNRLYRLDLDDNEVEQLTGFEGSGSVGDGLSVRQAAVQSPRHLEVDREGNVFFVDERNHRIRRFTPGKKDCTP